MKPMVDKNPNYRHYARFTMHLHYDYKSLIMNVLRNLEPLLVPRNTIFYEETHEVMEVTFI